MAKRIFLSDNYIIVDNEGDEKAYSKIHSEYDETSNAFELRKYPDKDVKIFGFSEVGTWFDEADAVAYTEATLRTFLRQNTGFKEASGGSGASSGPYGIGDSVGEYTYYDTITLAMAGAVAGQTIEMFADVTETNVVEVIWKDGVNGEANGHTYTYTNSDGVCFSDNNSAVKTTVNFNVVRTSATITNGTQYTWLWANVNSEVRRNGGTTVQTVTTGSFIVVASNAKIHDGDVAYAIGNGVALSYQNTNGEFNNSYGQTTVGARAVENYAKKSESVTGICIGAGTHGILAGSGVYKYMIGTTAGTGNGIQGQAAGRFLWCYMKSVSGNAGASAKEWFGCYAESDSGAAYSTFLILKDSTGISGTGITLKNITNTGEVFNNVLISNGNRVIQPTNIVDISKNTIISNYDNVNGDGIYYGSAVAGTVVLGNLIKVANSGANAIHSIAVSTTVDYTNNIFDSPAGATFKNVNITNGITNTPDLQGNITIR